MYAVVQTGGKQYRVSEGDIIKVEKLDVEAGQSISLEDVLVVGGEGTTTIGAPFIEGASVACNVVENGKAAKVYIYKYKAKKDYRKKQGHRQPYTMLKVESIVLGGAKKAAKAAAPKAEKAEKAAAPNLKAMKKAELIEFAAANKIELNAKATNAEMIATIEAALK